MVAAGPVPLPVVAPCRCLPASPSDLIYVYQFGTFSATDAVRGGLTTSRRREVLCPGKPRFESRFQWHNVPPAGRSVGVRAGNNFPPAGSSCLLSLRHLRSSRGCWPAAAAARVRAPNLPPAGGSPGRPSVTEVLFASRGHSVSQFLFVIVIGGSRAARKNRIPYLFFGRQLPVRRSEGAEKKLQAGEGVLWGFRA